MGHSRFYRKLACACSHEFAKYVLKTKDLYSMLLFRRLSRIKVSSLYVLTGSGLKVKTSCTTKSNTVCEPLEGFYCVDFKEGGCAAAEKHTSCRPGQYISESGWFSCADFKLIGIVKVLNGRYGSGKQGSFQKDPK